MSIVFENISLDSSEDKKVEFIWLYNSLKCEAITSVSCNNMTVLPEHVSKRFSVVALGVSRVGCCI